MMLGHLETRKISETYCEIINCVMVKLFKHFGLMVCEKRLSDLNSIAILT